jgi:hypothetical protein
MIVQLRRAGWTRKRIGQRVGMTESGVKRAPDRTAMAGLARA